MGKMKLENAVNACEQLQKQIKYGEEHNLDETELIRLRKEYDYYYKLVVKLQNKEKKNGKKTNPL